VAIAGDIVLFSVPKVYEMYQVHATIVLHCVSTSNIASRAFSCSSTVLSILSD